MQPTAAVATVTLNNGPATIQANFRLKTYSLTITATSGGTLSPPAGVYSVTHGQAFAISTAPATSYEFADWSILSGSAAIASAGSPATTVTLTQGNAVIQANFATYHGIQALGGNTGQGTSLTTYNNHMFISAADAGDLFVSHSSDYGRSWQSINIADILSSVHPANYDNYSTSISTDGNQVFITYLDYSTINLGILRSSYSLSTWNQIICHHATFWESGYHASQKYYNGNLYISHQSYNESAALFTRAEVDFSPVPGQTTLEVSGLMSEAGYTALDRDAEYVYVAFFHVANQDLKFVRSADDGSTWGTPWNIITEGDVGRYPSLVAVGQHLYLSYYDATNGDLELAHSANRGLSWTTSAIDTAGNVGQYTSIASADGWLYISYYSSTNGDLKLARSDDGGVSWLISTLDSTGNVGGYTSLVAMGATVSLSYYDFTNDNVKFARLADYGSTW